MCKNWDRIEAEIRQEGAQIGKAEGHKEGFQMGKEEGLQQGKTEGHKEGLQEGMENTRKEMAIRMMKDGMDTALVGKYTGLSFAELKLLGDS